MNLIGVKNVSNTLKRMSSSGISNHNQNEAPSEEELLLKNYRDIIEECSNIPSMKNTAVQLNTKKRRLKEKNNQSSTSIYFANVNPEGLHIEGLNVDLSQFSAIGKIGADKIFLFDKNTKELYVFEFIEKTTTGPHDEYYQNNNLLLCDISDAIEFMIAGNIVKENGKNKEFTNFYKPQNSTTELEKLEKLAYLTDYIKSTSKTYEQSNQDSSQPSN